jgi:hypothetical protein
MMFKVRLGYESLLMSWPKHFDTSDQLHQLHTVRIHKGCSSCNHCLCLGCPSGGVAACAFSPGPSPYQLWRTLAHTGNMARYQVHRQITTELHFTPAAPAGLVACGDPSLNTTPPPHHPTHGQVEPAGKATHSVSALFHSTPTAASPTSC